MIKINDYDRVYKDVVDLLTSGFISLNDALLKVGCTTKRDCFFRHITYDQGRNIHRLLSINKGNKRKTNKKYLGRLCKNGHEYLNTGKTLRYKSNFMCCDCHNQLEGKQGYINNIMVSQSFVLIQHPITNKKYKLGRICPNGHKYQGYNYSLRFKSNGVCVCCNKIEKQTHKEHYKLYREANKERISDAKKNRRNDPVHRKRNRDTKRRYDLMHRDQIRLYKKSSYERMKNDPLKKINLYMGIRIRTSLKQNKNGRHWESIVGYTKQELKQHLEARFTPKMSWDNYGTYWHIDHKMPIKWFVDNFELERGVRLCWSLKNLRPMTKYKNLYKSYKIFKTHEKMFVSELLQ